MRRAFTNNMRFNFTATVVSLLLQSRAAHCSKENDDKSPITELSSFLKQFGDKNAGDVLAKAAGFSKPESNSDFNFLLDGVSENVRKVFETGKPQEIGYGFMMGYCSGYCVKKVSKIAAFSVGGVFIGLQALSYNGIIKIDYDGVQKKIEGEMDLNHDGKVDSKDLVVAYSELNKVLSFHMPSGGGFSAGLYMGLRG